MTTASYERRRGQLEAYFDRTAAEAWKRLTSDARVGRIRASVRAGRNDMRDCLLTWLPNSLAGSRVLDAGCGTGALATAAAQRGADVVAVDIAASLVQLAHDRASDAIHIGRLEFRIGDMLDDGLGRFDHVVAMDSLIHYTLPDMMAALERLALRTNVSVLFTFAPRTLPLAIMHSVGKLFPRSDRSPAIEPVSERDLRAAVKATLGPRGWSVGRSQRVSRGFYISHALELVRA